MPQPTLLTVILNYRTPDMTIKAVAAAVREMAGIAGEITVVDNDSRDGSFDKLQAAHLGNRERCVRVVQAGRNGGYGAGNNVGIRAGLSQGEVPDYVYILNSDAFPDAGAIRLLVDYLEEHPEVGLAGSYIHGPDGLPHATAFRFPTVWSEFEGSVRLGVVSRALGRYTVPLPIPSQTTEVDWLAGASVMFRRSVLETVGLFDERFFLYFDETDLCRRARMAGFSTVYVRESEVTHIGSASTGMKEWKRTPTYWFDSRLRYFVKNHGIIYAGSATLAHMLGGVIWRIRMVLQRKASCDPPHFLGDLASHALNACLRRPARSRVSRAAASVVADPIVNDPSARTGLIGELP